ncbi:MAG TPA: iron ABC transporter permease [Usitatibacter sp.]|nr:iron ABC transporter permease [Usitatibacter sp.]
MRKLDTAHAWWVVAAAGASLLPWHAQPESSSSALALLLQGHTRFLPVLAALAGAAIGATLVRERYRRGSVLLVAGLAGVLAILLQGWLLGFDGWRHPFMTRSLGAVAGQPAMGLGAVLSFTGLLFLATEGSALRGYFNGERFVAGAVGLLASCIFLFTAWPVLTMLGQVFIVAPDASVLGTLGERLFNAKIWGLGCMLTGKSCGVAWNSLVLALVTAATCTMLGLAFALIVVRTDFRYRRLVRLLTVMPIITPSFVLGMGLILIFGRSGLVNQASTYLFDVNLGRWLYGFNGIWLAQVFSFTPTAFLILIGVLEGISPTIEEASQTLRASPMRTFMKVTLPLMAPGLANGFLVVFIESLADFGNPLVLGGTYGVLSTEIFFAVVGAQADFGRAATLALVLLSFALAAFFAQSVFIGKRSYTSLSGKGDAGLREPLPPPVRRCAFVLAIPVAVFTVALYALILMGGFVKVWGRDWTFTLSHYQRAFGVEWTANGILWAGGAWQSFFTTVQLAALAAPLTAALGLLAAWIFSRQRFRGSAMLEFALMLTFCVPGTVIGVAYILTFNVPPLELTGTATILVLCFIFRNLPVGVRSGMASLSQLDRSLDEASVVLGASTTRTLARVVLPLIKPAIVTALVYSFVRAMTTVSAVIFLVSAKHEMATVYIINRTVNGDYGPAIAYSTVLILMMMGAIGLIHLLVGQRRLGRREAAVAIPGAAGAMP